MAEAAGGAPAGVSGGQAGQSTGQGGGSAAPAAPAAERGRIGDFSSWSGRQETTPNHEQQISLQDPSLVGRQQQQVAERDQNEGNPFAADDGYDAQAQALVVDDSNPSEVLDPEAAQTEYRERLKRLDEWEASDELPEPFHQRFVVATIDGQRYRIPVAEAVAGYQRNSDYSNRMREVYAFQKQLQGQFQGLQALLADLDDGQTFIDAMIALKKFPGFHRAAIIYGKQLAAEQAMTPEQRAMVSQNRALRAQNQELVMRMNSLNQQVQQVRVQQPNQHEQFILKQVEMIWPKAAARVQWVDSPAARREFELHFENMLPTLEGKEITTAFVMQAMQAAMESIQAQLRAGQDQQDQQLPAAVPQRQQLQRGPMPPGRSLPGPAPSSQNGNGMQRRARIGDLGSLVGRRP